MAMIGTKTLLTWAMRWIPPKAINKAIAVMMHPTTKGSKPKALSNAPQMALLWIEL